MRMNSRKRRKPDYCGSLSQKRTEALIAKGNSLGFRQRHFHPLQRGTRQVRILLVHPGTDDQPIVCEHKIVSLDEPGEFEALSYSWGQQDNSRSITLNNTPFRISSALERALHYLRRASGPRRLWIDAICIDQNHDEEKLHQVAQMRSIYESASQVLVWLGPPSNNSDAGFDLMGDIVTHWPKRIELPLDPLAGILDLLLRPYWLRMWIIQEIAVASKDPIIGCGTKWLAWSMFGNALREVYVQLSDAEASKKRGIYHPLQIFCKEKFYTDLYTNLHNIRLRVQGKAAGVPDLLRDPHQHSRTNLLELVAETRYKFSTDPRDCIYALLGLIRSKIQGSYNLDFCLTPDYTKTHWRVYREVTKLAMETEETLEVLHCKNHPNCSELPSWVPDFSKHWTQTFPALSPDYWHGWSASGTLRRPSERLFRISLDLETLYANGAFVDCIERTISLEMIEIATRDVIQNVHNTVFNSAADISDRMSTGSRYLVDAIWRSLVGNRSVENTLPAPSSFLHLYLAVIDSSTPLLTERKDNELSLRPFIDSVLQAVRMCSESPHRRFIISRKGLLGLGPPDCQPGDSMCILFGYKMPVILRPLSNHYQFLGSAYVHGIMHGEGIPSWETGEVRNETFVIQ